MANEAELQQCEAETNSGQRCKRKAQATFRREIPESFLFFKWKKVVFYYYCSQHAERSMVGERVE